MKRLHEYQPVTINVPFVAREARTIELFDACVLALVDSTAALAPDPDVDLSRIPGRVENSLLSFRVDNALIGLKGLLRVRHSAGDVRFTVADGVQVNRRSATRIRLSLPMHLHKLGTTDAKPARSVDLSADGILAETALQVAVGDLVQLTIMLDAGSQPVEATAHVVRQGGGLVGLQIAATETGARARLARLVVAHNRERLEQHATEIQPVEF